MKEIISSIILFALVISIQAQNPYVDRSTSQVEYDFLSSAQKVETKKKTITDASAEKYSKIHGNPFWHERVMGAKIIQNNDIVVNNVPLQFDQYLEEIVARPKVGDPLFLETRLYREIHINTGTNIELFMRVHPEYPSKFYQVLHATDEVVVFKDIQVKLKKTQASNLFLGEGEQDFIRKKLYFLKKNNEIIPLLFKKKKFYASFNKVDQRKMQSFERKNKLKLKQEADFIALLKELYPSEQAVE